MMWHYISADLRRVARKPSFCGVVGAFALLFAVLIFIYFNPTFTMDVYVAKVVQFLGFFPFFIGGVVFLAVYVDDFKCKSMQVAIGYGMSRSRLVLAKLLESVLLVLGVSLVMTVLVLVTPMLLGLTASWQQLAALALSVMAEMFRAFGYIAMAAVLVFLTQDGSGGIIAYVLLSTKTVYIVLSMILSQDIFLSTFGDCTQYLYTALLYTVKASVVSGTSFLPMLVVTLLLYVGVPTVVAVIGFQKKELEF
ncbi:MAG: hypothetical protein UDB11_07860 [Peptococcaceae bacterium]|nr:hypothetical protein [Peptococcaceae bacterium]